MDDEDRQRWAAIDRLQSKRLLADMEARERREVLYQRWRWPLRVAFGLFVVAVMAIASGVGWMLGDTRPREIIVRVVPSP